jgi:small conductance mechanosensitive channel
MAPPHPQSLAIFDRIGTALSGDRMMLHSLVGAAGAFSMRLLVAGLILVATLWAADRIAKVVERALDRVNHRHPADKTLSNFVSALVRYLVIAIGLVAVLEQLGVQATSVLAVLGAASLAIGLALQGTLGNVAAGVMILLQRPYRVGDRVELGGKTGKVAHLDLFNTKLADYDGRTIYLPNGKVFGDTIINLSQSGRRRIDIAFGIDYDDDVDTALKLLLDVAAADARVLADPKPWANVTGLADSAVNVTVRCWTSPDDWSDVKFDLTKSVKKTFERAGLSFPYPHQVSVERQPRSAFAEGSRAMPTGLAHDRIEAPGASDRAP